MEKVLLLHYGGFLDNQTMITCLSENAQWQIKQKSQPPKVYPNFKNFLLGISVPLGCAPRISEIFS